MYIFDNAGSYDNDLHKIYLKQQRNPNTSVRLEIDRIANDDDILAGELMSTYCDRYGYPTDVAAKNGYVYLMLASGFYGFLSPIYKRYKIGKSSNPRRRHTELNGQQAPCPIQLIRYIQVDDMSSVETSLHKKFNVSRRHGEWFDFWFWQVPLVHLAYGRYQRDFRVNKMASLPAMPQSRTALIAGFAFLLVASAFVTSLISQPQSQSAPAQIQTAPAKRTTEPIQPKQQNRSTR